MSAKRIPCPPPLHKPEYCEDRGYHGPFVRRYVYDRHPEWEGMGECAACGSCRHAPSEEARRLAATGAEASPDAHEGRFREEPRRGAAGEPRPGP